MELKQTKDHCKYFLLWKYEFGGFHSSPYVISTMGRFVQWHKSCSLNKVSIMVQSATEQNGMFHAPASQRRDASWSRNVTKIFQREQKSVLLILSEKVLGKCSFWYLLKQLSKEAGFWKEWLQGEQVWQSYVPFVSQGEAWQGLILMFAVDSVVAPMIKGGSSGRKSLSKFYCSKFPVSAFRVCFFLHFRQLVKPTALKTVLYYLLIVSVKPLLLVHCVVVRYEKVNSS